MRAALRVEGDMQGGAGVDLPEYAGNKNTVSFTVSIRGFTVSARMCRDLEGIVAQRFRAWRSGGFRSIKRINHH